MQCQACAAQVVLAEAESGTALIERAKHDRDAFAILYRQHYQRVANYLYRRTGDVHATEDLVADVFLTALRYLPRYRQRGLPFRSWLYRIASNAANRWARQRRKTLRSLEDDVAAALPGRQPAQTDCFDIERAQRLLLELPPRHQTVLALHYLEGLSVQEVAQVIGCRVGTVKSRLSRARDALRGRLGIGR
jgi:RNA polymerase sigma-70 factor (ECF subfamily)